MLYFAMAWIKGESLEAKLKREGMLDERQALALTRKLASALAYAWNSHQLLHRDIKPSNVLLDEDGEPHLVDFGLAKSLSADAGLTMSSTTLGTPNYMSPEQVADAGTVDVRADMYSLMATMYNMVTGQAPFAGSSVMEVLKKQVSEPLPDPREYNGELSEGCVALMEIMLAKDREQRHGSWEEVLGDIDRVLKGEAPTKTPLAAGQSTLMRIHDKAELAGLKKQPRIKTARPDAARSRGIRWLGMGVRAWAGVGVGVAAVAVIAGVVLLGGKRGGADRPAVTARATQATEGTAAVSSATAQPVPPADDRQARLNQAYTSALEYKDAHADDNTGAIGRFAAVMKDAAGTEFEGKAAEQIKRLEADRKKAVESAWDALKAGVEKQAAEGKRQEAIERLEQYAGAYAAETAQARLSLAKELREKLAEAARAGEAEAAARQQARAKEEDAARAQAAQGKFEGLMDEAAAKLLDGEYAAAAKIVSAARSDSALSALSNEVSAAETLTVQVADWPLLVAASFERDKGKEVGIEFRGGRSEKLVIMGVADGKVRCKRALAQGYIEREFAVGEISAAEKLKRIGDRPTPDYAIMRGLAAYEGRNAAGALKEFASAGGAVGQGLERVVRTRVEAQQEALARQESALKESKVQPVQGQTAKAEATGAVVKEAATGLLTKDAAKHEPKKQRSFVLVPMKAPTEENLRAALEQLKADNPHVKQLKETHEIRADGIILDLNAIALLKDIKALAGLPLVELNLTGTKCQEPRPALWNANKGC